VHFIFMLTQHDRTVPNALEVYDLLRDTDLRYVGCKDVGIDTATLRALTARIQDDGREVMLEVVSTSPEDELRSVRTAVDAGVDWLLGGTNVEAALHAIDGAPLKYCPFPGTVIGHPSELRGATEDIAAHAAELVAADGVHGVDLLAYRHRTADPALLAKAVTVACGAAPVIAAGNVDSTERIAALDDAGIWGFTIGSAVFADQLPGAPDIVAQVGWALDTAAGR
jgi:hypothetical protein